MRYPPRFLCEFRRFYSILPSFMNFAKANRLTLLLATILLTPGAALPALSRAHIEQLRRAVVKIHVTYQNEDYAMPWQGGRPGNGTGSGFIVSKRRILTNAHVVSNARFIEVQKDGQAGRYPARVAFVGHDCDMAAIEVDDPAFFDHTRPLPFAPDLPRLNDEVIVIGYPTGGDRISVTQGVVSRIDYSGYSHSGVDQHLVLQVDAAINPGNSGGPILYRRRVVGLAFQGLAWADNIGYGIPLPVVNHFLEDIADGHYHGYPELGAHFMPARNPALRRLMGLPPEQTGVVLHRIDPFGSARGLLRNGDVLLSIDGNDIANDGNIRLDGDNVLFAELLERRQWGDEITFRVWRDRSDLSIDVPLTNPVDPFLYRNQYDRRPEYVIVGGLVFSPLSRDYLRDLDRRISDPNDVQLLYYLRYAKVDGMYEGRDEFVVLTRRLPHTVNTYAERFLNGIVARVNDRPVRCLADVRAAAATPLTGFHVVEFEGMDDRLILDAAAVEEAAAAIRVEYGVSADAYLAPDREVTP